MKKVLTLIAAGMLAGCINLPGDPSKAQTGR